MPRLVSLPMTSSQKNASPRPAKDGLQPTRVTAPKSKPKTKVVKKAVPKKGKKIMGHNKKAVIKGKPISKKMAVRKVKAR